MVLRVSNLWKTIRQQWYKMRRWQKLLTIVGLFLIVIIFGLYLWIFSDLPSIDNLQAGMMLPSTRIMDRNGQLLYEIIPEEGGRHNVVHLADIPDYLVQATIATEDRNFYSTPGIDIEGVIRALWINFQGGEIRAGGSTITQQVARNLLLDPQQRAARTLQRKLKEMVLALQLNGHYSKDEILALYLNQSYYGNMAYGVQAASQVYFNKDAKMLDLAESAMLAGLTQLPATHDPLTNPEAAKERQKVVLDLMVQAGYISQQEADIAENEPLHYGSGHFTINAPHFVLTIWDQLVQQYPDALYQGGLEVTTTLDINWQRAAEEIAKRHIERLNNPPVGEEPHNATDAALVALDPYTGEVRALLGSVDYFDEKINGAVNLAMSPRQPGSTLKPFTYAVTFDPIQPDAWTPATMILDVSTPFITQRLQSYTPNNYGLVEHGPVSIREALASSYNIPAVVALNHAGLDSMLTLLHKLGVSTLKAPTRFDLSVTLGGGEVRLIELTGAYAAFANGGYSIKPTMLMNVRDKDGKALYQWEPPRLTNAVLDPRVAYLITDILSDNHARLPAFGDHSSLQIGRPAAAKTGTTTDFRDNWTMGYTPNLVVGVWVGNADNTPMINVSGVTGAGPIWNEFMRTVLNGQPELTFERPDGLIQLEVCSPSGKLPTPYCPNRHLDWFIAGTEPKEADTMYQPFEIDSLNGRLATVDTPEERRIKRVFQVLPQEARDWGIRYGIEPPPVALHIMDDSNLRLLLPDPYTIFQLNPTMPFEAQTIRFSVAVPPGTKSVTYWLNDEKVETVSAQPYWAWWALIPGKHKLIATAELESGETQTSDPVYFTVMSFVPPDDRPASGNVE